MVSYGYVVFFFFSSRRRHTRFDCDWSSDVCSSDLTIPERPGAFREFCAALGASVVTEFNYRLSGRDQAEIFVGLATRSRHDGERYVARLRGLGYETVDLSGNEMAKLHVRHMVGGGTPHVTAERVCPL